MAFDVAGAKKEGYSDEEIAQYLAGQAKFDYAGAVKEGYTPTDIIGFLAKQPAVAPAKPSAFVPAAPSSEDLTGMLQGIVEPQVTAKPASPLDVPGPAAPAPVLPTAERFVVEPKFIQAVESQLNAMPAEQRGRALANLAKRPDVYGRAARDIQGRYKQIEQVQSKPARQVLDRRLEARTQQYIQQGVEADSAAQLAAADAARDLPPMQLAQVSADTAAEQAAAEARRVKEEMADAGFMSRVGAEMGSRFRQSALGAAQVYADLTGDTALQSDLMRFRRIETARGEAIPKGESIAAKSAQQAIATLGGQGPFILLGAMTGSAALPLAQAAYDQFSQSYGEARSAGKSPAEAATRAGIMATAEVFFERFGLADQMNAIRGVIDRIPTQKLSGYLAAAYLKQIPAEQGATLTQFLADKLPQIGLRPGAGLQDYFDQAGETLRQTVLQSGAQTALIYGGAAAARAIAPKREELVPPRAVVGPPIENIARAEGAAPSIPTELQAQPPAPPTPPPPVAAPAAPAAPAQPPVPPVAPAAPAPAAVAQLPVEETPEYKQLFEQYRSMRLPREEADLLARRKVEENRAQLEADAEKLRAAAEAKAKQPPPALVGTAEEIKRGQELTDEFIAAGFSPNEARNKAVEQVKQEAAADAEAAKAEGEQRVGAPESVEQPSGAGAPVAGKPSAGPPTGGAGVPKPSGVVPTKPPAGEPAGGEGAKPGAVKQRQATVSFRTPESGIVSNESVLGTLRRIEEDDDIALEYPDREGAVMLTGIDRQAGGQKGRASDVLKALVDWADKNNERIVLMPAASGDLKQPELIKWYERNGFVQKADGAMERAPAPKPAAPAPKPAAPATSITARQKAEQHKAQRPPFGAPQTPERKAFIQWENEQTILDKEAKLEALQGRDEKTITWSQEWEADTRVRSFADAKKEVAELRKLYGLPEAPAPKEPAKPRGRPKLVRTPEEVAAAAERRKQQQQTGKAAAKTVEALEKDLNDALAPLDESKFADDAALKEAQDDKRRARRKAINALYDFSRSNRNKPGQRATEILSRPEITDLERKEAKEGYELRKKAGIKFQAAQLGDTLGVGAPDGAFKNFTTGAQAVAYIARTGNAFQRFLANRIRFSLNKVKFVVIEQDDPLPKELQTAVAAANWENARGIFIQNDATGERMVFVRGASFGADQGVNIPIVLHELLHAATNQKIYLGLIAIKNKLEQDAAITKAIKELDRVMNNAFNAYLERRGKGIPTKGVDEIYDATGGDVFSDVREFLAYGMSDPFMQNFLMNVEDVEPAETFFSRFVDAIRSFFGISDDQHTAMSNLVLVTDKLLDAEKTSYMKKLERGEREYARQAAEAAQKVSPATADKYPTLSKFADEIEESYPSLAKLLRRRDLAELMGLMDLRYRTDPDYEDSLFWNRQLAGADTDETLGGQIKSAGRITFVQVKGPKDVLKLKVSEQQREEANALAKLLNQLFGEKLKGNWRNSAKQDKLALEYGVHPSRFDDMALEFYDEADDSVWALIFGIADARKLAFDKAEIDIGPALKFSLARKPRKTAAEKKVELSRDVQDIEDGLVSMARLKKWQDFKDLATAGWDSLNITKLKAILPTLFVDVIADWATSLKIPHVKAAHKGLQDMAAMRMNLLASSQEIVQDWLKLNAGVAGRTLLGRKNEMEAVADVMHQATLEQVDPSKSTANPKLNKMWDGLSKQAKEVYVKVRDYYRALHDLYRALLDKRIEELNIPGTIDDPNTPKGKLMAEIKGMYETAKKIEPYFPLMRYGQYWLRIGEGKGSQFFMFESAAARKLFELQQVRRVAAAKKVAPEDIEVERGNSLDGMRGSYLANNPGSLLKNIFDILDEPGAAKDVDALKDQIYQLYLTTMPEQSFRNQFIHRKGRAGFTGDALRNFITSSMNMANQLSRLKYGQKILDNLEASMKSLQGNPDKDKLEMLVKAVREHAEMEIFPDPQNPFATQITNIANRSAFIYMMTSVATAVMQFSSIPVFVLPVLMSRHNPAQVVKEMTRFLNVFSQFGVRKVDDKGNVSYVWPSIEASSAIKMSPEEKRAVEEMRERGLAEVTLAYDLMERGQTPTNAYTGMTSKTMNAFGALFHHAERLIREVTFMTSFRLSRNEGKSFDEAVEQAINDTYAGIGNFMTSNKPKLLKSNAGRLIGQFKTYPLFMATYFTRNFYRMIAGESKEVKKEAAIQFWGTMTMSAALAGYVGVPGMSFMFGVLQAIYNSIHADDEDDPLEKRDLELYFRTVTLPYLFGEAKLGGKKLGEIADSGGLNALTGYDLASRMSMNNMFLPELKESPTFQSAAADYLLNLAGPFVSLAAKQFPAAIDDFSSGHILKGTEKLLPNLLRQPVTAYRLSQEGATTKLGDVIKNKDEFTEGQLLMQALGFRTEGLAARQTDMFKVNALKQEVMQQKNKLIARLDLEASRGDDEGFDKTLDKIILFNAKNPAQRIEPDDLSRSILRRIEARASSDRGFRVDEKFYPQLQILLDASAEKLEREAAKAKK